MDSDIILEELNRLTANFDLDYSVREVVQRAIDLIEELEKENTSLSELRNKLSDLEIDYDRLMDQNSELESELEEFQIKEMSK
jgi:uncharacterized coiled-coil DUF342 family protein